MVAFQYATPLRIVQGALALLILCMMAYVVDRWSPWWSPSQNNFLLFDAIWTLLAVAYLIIAPLKFPTAAHKFGILAVELLTVIFWFAGWIAVAVLLGDIGCARRADVCRVDAAAVAFAAIEWLLFLATSIMASLHVYRTRNHHSGKHDPAMEVNPSV